MRRVARAAWALLAVVAVEAARLFTGLGRVRGRVPTAEGAGREENRPPTGLEDTIRQLRRFVAVVWVLNVVVAGLLLAAVVGAV